MSWATLGARIIDGRITSPPRLVKRKKGTAQAQASCLKCRQYMIRDGNSNNKTPRLGCKFCDVTILVYRRLPRMDKETESQAVGLFCAGRSLSEVRSITGIRSQPTAVKLKRVALGVTTLR